MSVNVMRDHLGGDEEQRSRRNTDVATRMVAATEITLMEAHRHGPPELLNPIGPPFAYCTEAIGKVDRNLAPRIRLGC